MKKMQMIMALLGCCAANGETWYYFGAGYRSDAFTNTVYWKNGDRQCGGITAADDFVVANWNVCWSPKSQAPADYHFSGRSLTVGDLGATHDGTLEINVYSANTKLTFDNKGLFLANGYLTGLGGYRHRPSLVYGDITVLSPESAPFRIWSGAGESTYTNRTLTLNGNFISAAGTMAIVGDPGKFFAQSGNITTNFTLHLAGSCSEYRGRLKVSGKRHYDGDSYDTRVLLAVPEFSGSITVDGNGILELDSAARRCAVGSLDLESGALLKIPVSAADNARFVVANAFSAAGTVELEMALSKYTPVNAGCSFTVIEFPADCDVDPGIFKIKDAAPFSLSPACYRTVVKEVDGGKALVVEVLPLVTLETGDRNTFSKGYDSAFDKDESWSDGHRPEAGKHYLVQKGQCAFRSPEASSAEFAGDSLTVKDVCTLMVFSEYLKLPVTRFCNARFASGSHVAYAAVEADRFEFTGDRNNIIVQIDGEMEMIGPWEGNGIANITGNIGHGSNGRLRITGDNSEFMGKIRVTVGDATPDPDAIFQTLLISDGKALGGHMGKMMFDALELTAYGTLEVTNSFEVTADRNRGIYVNGIGRVNVPANETLAVSTLLTVDGTLVKLGSGTLSLGGGLNVAESSKLQVADGVLKVAAADAVNGLSVEVSQTAALSVDPLTATGDLVDFGIRNDRAQVPFASASGEIELLVGGGAVPDDVKRVECALYTVDSGSFAAVDALVKPRRNGDFKRGWAMRLSSRDNGDGTTTKLAELQRIGFVITVR